MMAGAGGFEPPTTGFGDQRSGQTELRSCGMLTAGLGPVQLRAGHQVMVPLEGLEPPPRDLGRRRSVHLSYRGKDLVEIGGLEPPTSALRTPRSPN